ncbi:MAG: hypothetical protein ACI4XM_08250 [Candidatus Coprovivens sp.]
MACKQIEEERKRNKKIIRTILLIILFIVIITITIIFHKNIFKNISWESISVIIACLTLIISIITNTQERKNNITLQKRVRDQEKFEEEIEKILDFYPRILEDYIKNTNFELRDNLNPQDTMLHFDIKSLDAINAMNTKYACEIITINNKVDYLYKFHTEHHPEFDKLKIKINDMNQVISNEINNFSILVNECLNGRQGFSKEEANHKVEKRTIYLTNIKDTYQNNISELYVLAYNCIEERNELSLK